jgi:hypothetical protein
MGDDDPGQDLAVRTSAAALTALATLTGQPDVAAVATTLQPVAEAVLMTAASWARQR